VALIFGSGLSVVPAGAVVEAEIPYGDLDWPEPTVVGHRGRLLVARLGKVRLLLLDGRVHLYEGWSSARLARPIVDLAIWGVPRLLITSAAGGLGNTAAGTAVVVDRVVDLQRRPRRREPPVYWATEARHVETCAAALRQFLPVGRGAYVALPGPQYETPAEARWLARYGQAVGMSTAPEVKVARQHGLEQAVLALVVNTSGASVSHAEVVAAGERIAQRLRLALPAVLRACWPGMLGSGERAPGDPG